VGARGDVLMCRKLAAQLAVLVCAVGCSVAPRLALRYFGVMRMAPSSRITSPLSMSLVTIWCTSLA
jgi:hypothetical protein